MTNDEVYRLLGRLEGNVNEHIQGHGETLEHLRHGGAVNVSRDRLEGRIEALRLVQAMLWDEQRELMGFEPMHVEAGL